MVTDQAKTEKRICVVLDANIWIRERLLNSSIGAAFLYRLAKINGSFALPEITEREVISKTILDGARAVNRIRNDLATVRTLIGKTEEVELPNDESFAQAAKDRLEELGDTLIRVEITLGHYKNALERVLLSTPPNAAKEQYRDSLLWEAVLQLSSNYEIAFITNDSDFYESNSLDKGLAGELLKECQSSQSTVSLYRDLPSYLRSFSQHVPSLDYNNIALMLSQTIREEQLRGHIKDKGVELGDLKEHSIEAFITERRRILALRFKLSYRVFNVRQTQIIVFDGVPGGRLEQLEEAIVHPEARLVVSGDCSFDGSKTVIFGISLDDIDCVTLSDEPIVGFGVVFMSGLSGRREIPHQIRRPIDDI